MTSSSSTTSHGDDAPTFHTEKPYQWKEKQEYKLKEYGDHAKCFYVMHDHAFKKFQSLNTWFSIPVIIISTATGAASFTIPGMNGKENVMIYIAGCLNLISAILATISNFIGCAQKMEGHKVAALSWSKLIDNIKIELGKDKLDRIDANEYIKYCESEYNRIKESSPPIPSDIVKWFRIYISIGTHPEDVTNCFYQCLYIYFFFPCGCNIQSKKLNVRDPIHNNFKNMYLPETVGGITPIKITAPDISIKYAENPINLENKYKIESSESVGLGCLDNII